MIAYNDEYETEIKDIIRLNPKNYIKVLKSKGFKGRCPDRTYLVDYIYACTPMLDDRIHTFKTRIYWTINRLSDFPECMNDAHEKHKMTTANVKRLDEGYPQYCDSKCQHEAPSYYKKTKQGLLDKYGVGNAFQIEAVKNDLASRKDEIQAKRDATRILHFGDEPGWNLKQSIATRRKKYGSAWNQEAVRKTKAALRGDPNWNNPEKNTATKRKRGTFNVSKPEKIIVEIFKQKFGNILTQYSSDVYPYCCDIYVPANDIYIEYNGTWTHGGHPFDSTNESDIKQLEKWRQKNTKYYLNAIETWTQRDVEKRNTAKRNNINLVELWNMDDVRNFFGLNENEFDNLVAHINCNVSCSERDSRKKDAEKFFAKYGRQAFEQIRLSEFPYIDETAQSASYELKRLSTDQTKDQTPSRLIRSFHKSMFSCRRKGMLSPFKYWDTIKSESYYESGEWHDFYVNRFVYAESKDADILRTTGMMSPHMALDGFTITHRADCVSYLKPMLAKRLITKYLHDSTEIFCPFNGFSGIMLGATVGCRKKYIGRDLNSRQIAEAKELVEYIRKTGHVCDADLDVADVFESSGEYDSLFCCPPYENLEMWNFSDNGACLDANMRCDEWIDICLERFKCRSYMFVVDDKTVGKYSDRIVETLNNKSHFGNNAEYVVLI